MSDEDSGFSVSELAIGRILLRHCRPYLLEVLGLVAGVASTAQLDAVQSFVDEQWERLAPETIDDHRARTEPLRAAISAALAEPRQ